MLNKIIVVFLILIGASLAGGSFYWFEFRPTEIRKECSWTKDRKPDTLAFAQITQEEADRKNTEAKAECESGKVGFLHDIICEHISVPQSYKPAQQGEAYVRASTKEEYTTCLRHNGLD